MRPLAAVFIWIVLIGGLAAYMRGREPAAAPASHALETPEGIFSLELTTTFGAEPDPFSPWSDSDERSTALLVRLNGLVVLRETERTDAGKVLRIEPLTGLLRGKNELFIEASPRLEPVGRSYAARLRVLKDRSVIAERSLWSDPGGKIAGTLGFDTEGESPEESGHGR
jgi:hypothetical protein